MKKVAVLQSNYIPWKGYFDIINDVDEFIFYDEVQYTTRDWRNRNKIYTQGGPKWLTVPCKSRRGDIISSVVLNGTKWQADHYNRLFESYRKAPCWDKFLPFVNLVYKSREWEYLSDLNQFIITYIAKEFLGIKTLFSNSIEYESHSSKDEKLLSLLKSAGATDYVSGPAAKSYMNVAKYNEAGINVTWKDYSGYPEYNQLYDRFEHNVTILDLLFNEGENASQYIWGWRE